jgi:hypothetical protein
MLMGLKIMAIAELEIDRNVNISKVIKPNSISYCRFSDILLRCDFRVLKNETDDVVSIIKDIMKPLSI